MQTKNFKILCLAAIIICGIGCTKETGLTDRPAVETANENIEAVEPIDFASADALRAAVEGINSDIASGAKTKSAVPGFISYAETVMQEEGYDERPNAICSEAFGAILNPAGEVIFGDYMLKVCDCGILYSSKLDIDKVRDIAEDNELPGRLVRIPASEFPIPADMETGIYRVADEEGIYLYDTFGLFSSEDNPGTATPEAVLTKASVVWAQEGFRTGPEYDREYVWPKSQKNKFPSNNKVANDTKIYKQNYAVYSEAGVKTKTMKKKGLVWNKFDANVTSGITYILIKEGAYTTALDNFLGTGWLDINTTKYPGRSFVIATKVVNKVTDVPSENTGVIADCNAAINWAQKKGKTVENIDGIRYLVKQKDKDGKYFDTRVRIKDIIVTKYDSKNTIIFKLKTERGTFSTSDGMFGQFKVNSEWYSVDNIYFYGFSEYNNEWRGSILRCTR